MKNRYVNYTISGYITSVIILLFIFLGNHFVLWVNIILCVIVAVMLVVLAQKSVFFDNHVEIINYLRIFSHKKSIEYNLIQQIKFVCAYRSTSFLKLYLFNGKQERIFINIFFENNYLYNILLKLADKGIDIVVKGTENNSIEDLRH